MGNYRSTRWNLTSTKASTDGLLSLDVHALSRAGMFMPGTLHTVTWGDEAAPRAQILTIMHAHRPVLLFHYNYRAAKSSTPTVIREVFEAEKVPGTLGGSYWYLKCPGCGFRRARMYSYHGHFRCRACHNLNYGTTRESAVDRANRRIRTLQHRLGGDDRQFAVLPDKPPGMQWRTYDRLARKFYQEVDRHLALCLASAR